MRGRARALSLVALVAQVEVGALGAFPKRLIIDTDMSTDIDDVGALCVAHALQDLGYVEILAVVHNTGLEEGVGAISSVNHYFRRDGIPIGAFSGTWGSDLRGPYAADLVNRAPGPIRSAKQVPSAVEVYRRVLAAQAPGSVIVVSIGFLTNLAELLRSGPDLHSELSGAELVASRVASVAVMGGQYPSSGARHEWNFGGGGSDGPRGAPSNVSASAASEVVAGLPESVEVTFLGLEVGEQIISGARLSSCAPPHSPCRMAYTDMLGPHAGRPSWDPATLLFAVLGAAECEEFRLAGEGGYNVVDRATGSNRWQVPSPQPRKQSYVVLQQAGNETIGANIDDLLCHQPGIVVD